MMSTYRCSHIGDVKGDPIRILTLLMIWAASTTALLMEEFQSSLLMIIPTENVEKFNFF
jgi:hypothetical protein